MRTLLVVGTSPLPRLLREVVERGSTSLVETPASELDRSRPPADADRIVLWAAPGDAVVTELARAYARGASPERKDTLIVVSPESAPPPADLAEVFVWPRDEDRLKLAFMTGG